jgi:hypothetical protein
VTVEALASDDPRWDQVVDEAPTPDVYFRPGYCTAYELAGEGRLVAVRTETSLFPLLLRELPFGEDGCDAVTPFGHGGLLPLANGADLRADVDQLRDWCRANGVISCLLRLHPLLGAFEHLSETDGVDVLEHGPTSAVDLSRLRDGRLAGMSKGRKADLSAARRELEVSWEAGSDALEAFRAVYEETMVRLGAGEKYFFAQEYYRALADGLGAGLGIALARRNGDVVGGSLFLADPVGPFAHYHLSGTTEAGRELKAGTLLVHEGAMWASRRGCTVLHLGGGAGGADSVYAFKRSFGGEERKYLLATVVADESRYGALVARRAEEADPPRAGFFPAYRA